MSTRENQLGDSMARQDFFGFARERGRPAIFHETLKNCGILPLKRMEGADGTPWNRGLAGAGRSRIDPHHFPHMDRAGRGFSVRWLHAISAIQIALPILPTRTVSVIPSPMIGSGRERPARE
jgi:hypothetical protein